MRGTKRRTYANCDHLSNADFGWQSDVELLEAGQLKRFRVLALLILQRDDAHSDQI